MGGIPYKIVWGRAEGTASYLPYRGKIRRGKLTKFSTIDEMFPRRNISATKFFPEEFFPE